MQMICSPGFFLGGPLAVGKDKHRWLRWSWTKLGGAAETLDLRLKTASANSAVLSGLVIAGAIPLPFAFRLFGGKIDACMRPGRWMYAVMASNAEELLNQKYDAWAKALLGVRPWKSARAACWELGWNLTGMARAVLDVVCRRARIFAWPRHDWYKRIFFVSMACPGTWAARSKALLWPMAGRFLGRQHAARLFCVQGLCTGTFEGPLRR